MLSYSECHRTAVIDAVGHRVAYQYDGQSNVIQITAPSLSTRTFSSFNAFSQPGKAKDARGNSLL